MRKFLIPSLLLAGFFGGGAKALPVMAPRLVGPGDDTGPGRLFDIFRQEHRFTLAGHVSHSSHASHASHRSSSGTDHYSHASHRSATTAPSHRSAASPSTAPSTAPLVPLAPPVTATPQTGVGTSGLPPLPGNSAAFIRIAMQVQTALHAYGYYDGPIDGIIGAGSREALRRFQTDYGLAVTGTITPEVLDRFGIVAG